MGQFKIPQIKYNCKKCKMHFISICNQRENT